MKTLQIILSIVTLAFIAECTTSSGVVPLGQNTYMISRAEKGFRGASTSVKAAALKEANLFGTRQGKVMVVIKTVQKDMKPFRSDAAAEVHFKALSPNDPELQRPVAIEEIRE